MIIKICKPNQYEIIPTQTLQDQRLALDELGLLVRLISRPNGWEIYPGALRKETGWGRDKLRKTLRNFQKFGYLRRVMTHEKSNGNSGKKPGTWKWTSELYLESQGVDFYNLGRSDEPPSPKNQGMVVQDRVIHTTDGPATDGPSHGQPGDIINTDFRQYRPNTTTPPHGNTPNLAAEFSEYLDLVCTYGGKGDKRPDDPEGMRDAARRRIIQGQGGQLNVRDKSQLSRWRRYRRRHLEACSANVTQEQLPLVADRREQGLEAIKKLKDKLRCG